MSQGRGREKIRKRGLKCGELAYTGSWRAWAVERGNKKGEESLRGQNAPSIGTGRENWGLERTPPKKRGKQLQPDFRDEMEGNKETDLRGGV